MKNRLLNIVLGYQVLLCLLILLFSVENILSILENLFYFHVLLFAALLIYITITGVKNVLYFVRKQPISKGILLYNIILSLLLSVSFRVGGLLFNAMVGPQVSVYYTSNNHSVGFEYSIWEVILKIIKYDMASAPGIYIEVNFVSFAILIYLFISYLTIKESGLETHSEQVI